MSSLAPPWRIWIDTGGTFTDCIAIDPHGRTRRVKVLSNGSLRARVVSSDGRSIRIECAGAGISPPKNLFAGARIRAPGTKCDPVSVLRSRGLDLLLARTLPEGTRDIELRFQEEAALLAARLVTGTSSLHRLPPAEIRFATTRGTNALLERNGDPPVLFLTRGLAEILEIGDQRRPELFSLRVEKPTPLYDSVVEIPERLRADGSVEQSLDREETQRRARAQYELGFRQAAVALMHSYRNPAHEKEVAAILSGVGFEHVSISSDLSPRIRLVPRAQTAVVDAYLARTVGSYLRRLESAFGARSLYVMNSAGGLARAERFHPKDSLLSGPAGGVIGAAAAAAGSGERRILSFDMGGTSTDVARYDERLEYRNETEVGSIRLASPSVAVETVAAGGGSVCRFDGRQLKVGPESAGAEPGPACYGRGGPLTLTDVNLLLGRLSAHHFSFPIDLDAARGKAAQLGAAHRIATGDELPLEELLFGFLRIANESMAGAIRKISVAAGYRPSEFSLVTFGGAGPQHACALAGVLGMSRVLVPADASLLSASGLGHARLERFAERQVLEPLASASSSVAGWFEELREEGCSLLVRNGIGARQVKVVRREVFLRFLGQESTLAVEWRPGMHLARGFSDAYRKHFGYLPREREIEVESLRLIVAGPDVASFSGSSHDPSGGEVGVCRIYSGTGWISGPVASRSRLAEEAGFRGPGWVVEEHTLTVVEQGWEARAEKGGTLVLERT